MSYSTKEQAFLDHHKRVERVTGLGHVLERANKPDYPAVIEVTASPTSGTLRIEHEGYIYEVTELGTTEAVNELDAKAEEIHSTLTKGAS